jgi:membrane fusion protein
MASDLFRQEALDAKSGARWGRPVGLLPTAWSRITVLLVLFIVALGIFLATAGFARKETVRGRLRPDTVEARVFSSDAGVVTKLHVALGDHVEAGDPIADIGTARQIDAATSLTEASIASLSDELASLSDRRTALQASSRLATERLQVELRNAQSEQESLGATLELLDDCVRLAEERLAAAERLQAEGAASKEEVRAREEALIVIRQQKLDVAARLAAARSREASVAVETRKNSEDLAQQLADMDQRMAQLGLQSTQARAGAGFTIKSPTAGRVAALQVAPGERVDPTQPLLTVIPEGQTLFAELYVPSRAIAFVEPGQPVRLLFDALPYQKFGPGSGKILSVSETTLTPQELRASVRIEEPVYRVTVRLDKQSMTAFSKDIPLQSGMELTADIILEERKLLEWLLEPLYAASIRMRGSE